MLPMPTAETFMGRLQELYRESAKPPKMLLISFPHNPTTICVDLPFLTEIVNLAKAHGTLIVHDFAYADLGFDGYKPPSILQVPGAKDIAVEIFSMSKSYNMAGWRVGFCLGNAKMIAALARIKSYLDYGAFQPVQIAAIVALRECDDESDKICAVYQKRRDVLVEGLCRAGWPVPPPRGSMFLWAGLPDRYRDMGCLEFSKLLMEKALVAVSPGIGFGPMGEGFVRFALIENEHRTRQATRSIGHSLRQPASRASASENSASKRVDDAHTGVDEISTISSGDRQIVNHSRRRDEAVLDRHRLPGSTKMCQQFCPFQPRVGVPGKTMESSDSRVEPAFERVPLPPSGRDQNPESQFAENHRINCDIGLMFAKPCHDTRIGPRFRRFAQNIGID